MKIKLWFDKYYHRNSRSYGISKWARGIYIHFGLMRMWLPFWGWEKQKMKVRMRCLVCGNEAVIDIPAEKHGELEIVPVPDCYCKKCKILVEQIIDGVAEKENEQKKS